MWSRLAAWRPSRLLLAWCVYWLALVLWGLGPVLPTLWRITRPDAHGSVSASVGWPRRLTLTQPADSDASPPTDVATCGVVTRI
jgi:hypothetical protein